MMKAFSPSSEKAAAFAPEMFNGVTAADEDEAMAGTTRRGVRWAVRHSPLLSFVAVVGCAGVTTPQPPAAASPMTAQASAGVVRAAPDEVQ